MKYFLCNNRKRNEKQAFPLLKKELQSFSVLLPFSAKAISKQIFISYSSFVVPCLKEKAPGRKERKKACYPDV
jgi:hypothetical protein